MPARRPSPAQPRARAASRPQRSQYGWIVIATVREWSDEEGWGVLSADEAPGDIFVHFSNIQMDGYKSLKRGERVEVKVVGPLEYLQDGCRYAAEVARPLR
jgi:cold shock protein